MANGYRRMLLSDALPDNLLFEDKFHKTSVMVRIPRMTLSELGVSDSNAVHPAFLVNGKVLDAVYISKYENYLDENGCSYSSTGRVPAYGLTSDEAFRACANKGRGWHLWTRAERALLTLICQRIGHIPGGNCDYGKDIKETLRLAMPGTTDALDRTNAVLTGSGPLSWTHNGTAAGIWNLKGNVWEWTGGIRLVHGELQILPDNDAADSSNSQAADSRQWKALSSEDGSFLTPDGKGTTAGAVRLSWEGDHWQWQTGAIRDPGLHCGHFEEITLDHSIGSEALRYLQSLALCRLDPAPGAHEASVFWANTAEEETAFDCGGRWNGGEQPSLFTVSASHPRDFQNDFAGFRAAYADLN